MMEKKKEHSEGAHEKVGPSFVAHPRVGDNILKASMSPEWWIYQAVFKSHLSSAPPSPLVEWSSGREERRVHGSPLRARPLSKGHRLEP